MPSIDLIAQADGLWRGWSAIVGGPTYAYQAISDGTSVTYVTLPNLTLTGTPQGRISFPALAGASGQIPISIILVVRARLNTGSAPTIQVGFSQYGLVGFDAAVNTLTATITSYTHSFAVNPITGLPWVAADMTGLEMCVQRQALVLGTARIYNIAGALLYSDPQYFSPRLPQNARIG